MKDYKLNIQADKIYLLDAQTGNHRIVFEDEMTAHRYKIALGLGTFPCPRTEPSYYQELLKENELTFRPVKSLTEDDEIGGMGCCHSGCPNCPF